MITDTASAHRSTVVQRSMHSGHSGASNQIVRRLLRPFFSLIRDASLSREKHRKLQNIPYRAVTVMSSSQTPAGLDGTT